jgi:hypothetical protein
VRVGRTKLLVLVARRKNAEIDQPAEIVERTRDELGELLFGEVGDERDSMLPRSGLSERDRETAGGKQRATRGLQETGLRGLTKLGERCPSAPRHDDIALPVEQIDRPFEARSCLWVAGNPEHLRSVHP